MTRTLTFVLLLAAACGGKDAAAPATPATTPAGGAHDGMHGGGHGMHGDEHHAGMSPELTRFHDLLRPRWHAEKGPARMADTCGAVPQFQTEADAIGKATPPVAAHADTWTTGTKGLVAAVADLATACKGTDSAAFEAAFGKVHDAFHGLMMAAGAHGKDAGGMPGHGGMHGSGGMHGHGGHAH